MISSRSSRRNLILADLFHRMGKVERIGSGIRKMKSLMKEAGLKPPVFEVDTFFRATFFRDPQYALKILPERAEKTVEKTVEKILSLIMADPQMTQQELMEKTGLTRRGVEWNLKKLKGSGRIRRVGPDKGGRWEIVETR